MLVILQGIIRADNSFFIYQFQGKAFPKKFSTVVSVSRMSAAAPLIQAAASGSMNEAPAGISILGGLAVVSVTEPLALPWVALGTATPFILGYRVVGDKIIISQAPKYITESTQLPTSSKTLALTFSDSTKSRVNSAFIFYQFHGRAFPRNFSTVTMVDGKAVFKTININKSASQDDKPLVPGGKLLDLGIDVHGKAFPRNFSTVVSVSRMSAAAPLTQAAASGSANEAIAATPNTGAAKGICQC
jgi:hypothetical protein